MAAAGSTRQPEAVRDHRRLRIRPPCVKPVKKNQPALQMLLWPAGVARRGEVWARKGWRRRGGKGQGIKKWGGV